MDRLTSLRDKLHTAFRSKSEGAEAAAAEAAAPTRAPIAHEVFSEVCPAHRRAATAGERQLNAVSGPPASSMWVLAHTCHSGTQNCAAAGKNFYTDAVVLQRGLTFLKGRVSPAQVFGTTQPDIVPGKYEGGLKLWECTIDLIETLRREIQDGRLSFRGKHVLELGCGHGLPGILACTKGAAVVHFQDFNEEVLLHLTIPNVHVNMASAKAKMAAIAGNGSTVKPSWGSTEIRYFAGDWADLGVGSLLSAIPEADTSSDPASQTPAPLESSQSAPVTLETVKFAVAAAPSSSTGSLSGLGDDATVETPSNSSAVEINAAMQGPGHDDARGGHVKLESNSNTDKDVEQRSSSAHARVHVTGTPAFYKQTSGGVSGAEEEEKAAPVEAGYDIVLMSETIYCMESYPKLLGLIRKVLRSPYGVMYVAGKKHYFGVGGGTRQFKNFVEEDGYLHSHLVAEFADGASNVREIWKFFFRKSD
eukprot:SM000003S11217  [mRNA]  locus=s3:1644579:1647510:+ [translate_table: standard]